MATKKEEPEWFTDKMDGHTIHIKNSKMMRDFFSSPKGVGNPLESHRMMILDMSDESSREHLLKQQVPIFPEVYIKLIDDLAITGTLYRAQSIVISSYVRVPDDEGNSYFTVVKSETTIPPVNSMEERSKYMSHAISLFNTEAYAMIILGVPDPTLKYDRGKGVKEPVYILDNDTRTERGRIKDIMNERGYKPLVPRT